MAEFLKLLLDYSVGIIPAFLFALLISAVLTEVIPDSFFEKILSKKGIIFVIISSIIGALIPLCTCGMIPLASKLQKKGASWLIVISFLTAGNASSITALLLTLVLGFNITAFRFLLSVIFGITVAYIFVYIFKPVSILPNNNTYLNNQLPQSKRITKEFSGLIIGFGPWVLAAIFLAAIIGRFLSPIYVVSFAGAGNFFAPFLFSIIGFPFYFCAGADVPIAKALLEKGAGVGNILAFMTAAPGVNLTSFLIYQRWLGLKSAIQYLVISALICGILGLLVNFVVLPLTPYPMR